MARKTTRNSETEDLPKIKITKDSLKKAARIFQFIGPHKWKFLLGLLFLAGTGATALLFPKLMGSLINSASMNTEAINDMGLKLFILFSFQAVFSYFRVVLFVNVTENMLLALRTKTYSQLIRMPMTFFGERRVGEINSRMSADLSMIQDTFTTNIAEFLRQFVVIIGGVIALFFTSGKLALMMLAVVPVMAVIAVVFGRYIRGLSRKVQDNIADSNVIVEETMQGIANVKSFANELFETTRYSKMANQIKELAIRGGKARGAFFSFIIFGMSGAIILVVWYAVTLQNQGELNQGQLVQFILYTLFVAASIGGIPEQYAQIQKAIGATDRLMDILEEKTEEITTSSQQRVQNKIKGDLVLDNIVFTYPSRTEITVLKGVSLSAMHGETVAIVGPSGSGKSTIASLLLRFYEPQYGRILIDNKDYREYSLYDLRKQIAIVPQDVLLFGGTIRENIAYGKPEASMDEIIDAAKKANAKQFIEELPEKYDTIVGERGVKLSGGQRQRIAIARAVLKNPSILILDEATSSLDSESERLVQEALDQLMIGRTSIVIAHRLSTIRNADKIIVLDKGEIKEIGTHQELIQNQNGIYQNLSRLQFEVNQ